MELTVELRLIVQAYVCRCPSSYHTRSLLWIVSSVVEHNYKAAGVHERSFRYPSSTFIQIIQSTLYIPLDQYG